jgi:hypothetical protein
VSLPRNILATNVPPKLSTLKQYEYILFIMKNSSQLALTGLQYLMRLVTTVIEYIHQCRVVQ